LKYLNEENLFEFISVQDKNCNAGFISLIVKRNIFTAFNEKNFA